MPDSNLRTLMEADTKQGGTFFHEDSLGNPDEMNTTVDFYPEYDKSQKVTGIRAHVFFEDYEGTREVQGDGVVFNKPEGRAIRQSIRLEIPADIKVRKIQPEGGHDKPDAFKINGEVWVVKRVYEEDDYLQNVLCVRQHDSIERTRRRSG